MIALLSFLFHRQAVVTPEVIILTPGFEAVWVPDGVTGPIVAAPFDAEVFEVNGE